MRNFARIAVILAVLIAMLLISPLFIGWYLKQHYQTILNIYNNTHRVSLYVDHFHKGWFSSIVTLRAQILDPTLIEYLGISNEENASKLGPFIIEQYIQHGPVFYHNTKGLPYVLGLAAIQNSVHSAPDINKAMKIKRDLDYISFRGNHYKYFDIISLNLMYPRTDFHMNIEELEGGAWMSPTKKRIQSNVHVKELLLHNPDVIVYAPQLNMQFDYDTLIWLGNIVLSIPSVSMIENENETLNIQQLNFESFSEITDGILNGHKELRIKQMNIDDYLLGPLHIDINVKQLNAKAVEEMVDAYKVITERGELYQSQLTRKMLMLLPGVLNPGASIAFNDFDIETQDGRLYIKGEFVWNDAPESMPDNFKEMLSSANAKIELKIATQLMNRWINVASTLPWFNRASLELDEAYNDAQHDMASAMELSKLGIMELVSQGKLTLNDAMMLIELQKTNASSKDYAAAIKELLFNKNITPETSYLLSYLYAQGQSPMNSINLLLQEYQQAVARDMSLQLERWIKRGYVKQQGDDYVVSFLQQKKRIQINGQWLTK